ncbi:hypothetical protein B0H65DRAFT_182999 [Neurospora tetraspora]|uniref:Uncharacterized protein n=1 Tax=Neurospora tetraspora TaxID=94610 RepID=A0AAE0JFH6_9PEZI|nr:hypothetical protein B0H65DRAFT_182999 [Neurospora tetraspora]
MRFHLHCRTLSPIQHCHMKQQKETLRQEQDIGDGELHKSPSRSQSCAHFSHHLAPPKSSKLSKGPAAVGRMALGRHRSRPTTVNRQVGHDNAITHPSPGRVAVVSRVMRAGSERSRQDPVKIQRKQCRSGVPFQKKRVRFFCLAPSWRTHRYHRITPPSADRSSDSCRAPPGTWEPLKSDPEKSSVLQHANHDFPSRGSYNTRTDQNNNPFFPTYIISLLLPF